MSVKMRQQWLITGGSLPAVRRRCPKCGQKTEFINSGKFRVNGNGRLLDVWLIYRCHQCKSTFNMTIYERVSPESLERKEYEGFLSNDGELTFKYGTSRELFLKNGVEMAETPEGSSYTVVKAETQAPCGDDNAEEIEIRLNAFLRLRADALFSQELGLTRNQVKKLFDQGRILCDKKTAAADSRVRDGHLYQIRQIL